MSRRVLLPDGPCLCDGRYDGCAHDPFCGQPNDGTGRGPWCAECNPRRLDSVRASLENLRRDLDAAGVS